MVGSADRSARVPLDDVYPQTVVFVLGVRGEAGPTPIGTAFVVGVPNAVGGFFPYLVTTAHVVRGEAQSWCV